MRLAFNIYYMKTCTKCKITKEISSFGKSKRKDDGISNICKLCNNIRSRNYNANNKLSRKATSKKYYLKNKERLNENSIRWLNENSNKFREYYKNYRIEKRKNDKLFLLKEKVRKLISNSFIRNKFSKRSKTIEILGCTFEDFKLYIESKFEPWMSWENKGLYNGEFNYGWDIDHIVPVSSAKDEYEIIALNHYTNFQPLCSKINRDIKRNIIS